MAPCTTAGSHGAHTPRTRVNHDAGALGSVGAADRRGVPARGPPLALSYPLAEGYGLPPGARLGLTALGSLLESRGVFGAGQKRLKVSHGRWLRARDSSPYCRGQGRR